MDGPLRYIPPAALHDGERYLIETYRLALYNLAAADKLSAKRADAWQVAGLGVSKPHPGFSPLPAVPAELEGIVKRDDQDPDGVIPGRVHLDEAFDAVRLAEILEERADYPVLHIASHFSLNPGNNGDSYLLLGDGRRLTLADINSDPNYALFGIDLLTLSACDTAVGQKAAGAEIESFGSLAQERGARGVLASLWSVNDEGTGQLMQRFYGRRAEDSTLTKAEALRQAQIDLLRGSDSDRPCSVSRRPVSLGSTNRSPETPAPDAACRWSHPHYWAPFVLMGNWL